MGEVGCRLLEKKYPEFRPVYELIYGNNLANDKWNETFLDTVIFNAVYRSHLWDQQKKNEDTNEIVYKKILFYFKAIHAFDYFIIEWMWFLTVLWSEKTR